MVKHSEAIMVINGLVLEDVGFLLGGLGCLETQKDCVQVTMVEKDLG